MPALDYFNSVVMSDEGGSGGGGGACSMAIAAGMDPDMCCICAPKSVCSWCEAGKYNIVARQSTCISCEAGTFQNTTGSTVAECEACGANSDSTPGSSACNCNDGFGISPSGLCEACIANAHSPSDPSKRYSLPGSSACSCRAGFFGDGITTCESCVANATDGQAPPAAYV